MRCCFSCGLLSQKRINRTEQLSLLHHAAGSPEYFPVAEQHEGRDGLNLVFLRQYAVCVHINLDDTDAVAQHVFHLFQNRVHHFTRLTPGGEEVHQYKLIACYYVIKSFQCFRF